MKQTTNPTGKGPTVKKSKKNKAKKTDEAAQKTDTAPTDQVRSFQGASMDQNQVHKSAIVSTRSQKPTVDSKGKTKVNSKASKNTKENSTSQQTALPARETKEVSKDAVTSSKSIKKTRAAKISSK